MENIHENWFFTSGETQIYPNLAVCLIVSISVSIRHSLKVLDILFRYHLAEGEENHDDGSDHNEEDEEDVFHGKFDAIVEEIETEEQDDGQPKWNHRAKQELSDRGRVKSIW